MRKRTKIVATIGPASNSEAVLRRMIQEGMDVARINFSHARLEDVPALVKRIRAVSDELNTTVAILGDLQGPRIRVGEMRNGTVHLEKGHQVTLTPEWIEGTPERISITFPEMARDVEKGTRILIADGEIVLKVVETRQNGDILCEVDAGGDLSNRKGINLPRRKVSSPSITDRDREAIDVAIENQFDFLALSFVQSAEDVHQLNELLRDQGSAIPVIAKIEKKSAVEEIAAIVEAAYGVMVGRGDLALEMSIEDVPIAQKQIVKACREASKPVITATQMLDSMTSSRNPTRAEATDVANAILDGTDSLMLSEESAVGRYPVESVETMARIAIRLEQAWLEGELPPPPEIPRTGELEAAVARAAQDISRSLNAKLIVVYTTTGSTSRRTVAHRPNMPVLTLTSNEKTVRRLALSWGMDTVLIDPITGTDDLIQVAFSHAVNRYSLKTGDTIMIVAGTPYHVSGKTNLMKVEQIP